MDFVLSAYKGELAALLTACLWTVTAMAFESAGRRIGSVAVNILRLVEAFFFLSIFTFITRGLIFPTDANAHIWIWLSLSGIIGFTLGDLSLFQALLVLGSRTALLLMSLVPLLTALLGYLFLGETLGGQDLLGMFITVGGVSLAVSDPRHDHNGIARRPSATGLLLGLGGAICQAVGYILSKHGLGSYDPFAATQIRALAGIGGFVVLYTALGWWPKIKEGIRNRRAMSILTLGAFTGPFLGVSFSLMALQYAKAGVAATILSLTPILIIPPAVLIYKEKISLRAVIGAILAIIGVALLVL